MTPLTRRSLLQLPGAAAVPVFDIRTHGARGDGATNDARAIQRTIDACTSAGGGVVYLPPGVFLSGTILLKDNVTLHLSPGAVLRGSRNLADFSPPHFIYARDATNIGIEGSGTIDGQGEMNWGPDFKPKPNDQRVGPLIELVGCRDIRIQDVAIRNSPRWTIHPKNCERVWIRGISIINHLLGPNTDGIDPDSSRHVHISDCYIEAGDDCIVIKTSNVLPWVPDGYGEPVRPCENVTVSNCTLISAASALKLGTESLADIRHCVFSNCVVRNSWNGIGLFAKDGGVFENISFSNVTIELRPSRRGYINEWPIFLDLEKRRPDSRVSTIRDVAFNDILIHTRGRILAGGMPDKPIEDVAFRNIRVRVTGYEEVRQANKPRGGTAQAVPRHLNYGNIPSALIFANMRGLSLRDVQVRWDSKEAPLERHALWARNVEDFTLDSFRGAASVPGKLQAMALEDCRDVFVRGDR